ncbi:hypothetical protein DSO57_1028413 [Entomophthora muscae]|uniref:Uncharacterized protein n=1 Tax=Entomophthora muscae TaxID=34485 RepID=A0ACC2RGA2_9FUNG|nr:hypothetical protein DSO57_1028413 [Entomophthora muscae]
MKHRATITQEHTQVMKQVFKDDPRPSKEVRQELATRLNLSEQTIRIWFQNQRTKARSTGELPAISRKHGNRLISPQSLHYAEPIPNQSSSPLFSEVEIPYLPIFKPFVYQPFHQPMNLLDGFMTPEEFKTIIPTLPQPPSNQFEFFF